MQREWVLIGPTAGVLAVFEYLGTLHPGSYRIVARPRTSSLIDSCSGAIAATDEFVAKLQPVARDKGVSVSEQQYARPAVVDLAPR